MRESAPLPGATKTVSVYFDSHGIVTSRAICVALRSSSGSCLAVGVEPPSRFVADVPGRTADATGGDELFMVVILVVVISFFVSAWVSCVVCVVCVSSILSACACGVPPWPLRHPAVASPFLQKSWRRDRQTDRASTRNHTQQKFLVCAPRCVVVSIRLQRDALYCFCL